MVKIGIKEIVWVAIGAAVFGVGSLLLFRAYQNHVSEAAQKAQRLDLVLRMQAEVNQASDAQNSAAIATTDEEARKFADQARAAIGEVERQRGELEKLFS